MLSDILQFENVTQNFRPKLIDETDCSCNVAKIEAQENAANGNDGADESDGDDVDGDNGVEEQKMSDPIFLNSNFHFYFRMAFSLDSGSPFFIIFIQIY
jgi:hypothetical protein